jgi:glutamate decarboxylase
MLDGSMMISYQPQDSRPNFFRIVFCNPATNYKDLDFVLDEIDRIGKNF